MNYSSPFQDQESALEYKPSSIILPGLTFQQEETDSLTVLNSIEHLCLNDVLIYYRDKFAL